MKAFSGVLVVFALGTIALAACSGSIGGSSAIPGPASSGSTSLTPQQAKAQATGGPASGSGNISIGGSPAPQALPTVANYAGSVFFPAASPAPSPGASASPVSVAVSMAVSVPTGAPDLEEHPKHNLLGKAQPMQGVVHHPLLYITFDATSDVSFPTFPAFAFNVPSAKITDKTLFGLAFFDPTQKTKAFKLAVASRDLTAAPSPSPSAKSAKPQPTVSGSPVATASPVATERVAFDAGTGPFAMKANTTYVFALYSFVPTPSPSPSASASASASAASASPASSAAPSASPSPVPSSTAH